jgi:PAS domain S-box-containing protein
MTDYTLEKIISSQQNFERVLDNLKAGIIAHDMNRCIYYFNREAEKITGYRREEILGRDCHEAFGSPFCGAHCRFCIDEPDPHKQEEYTLNITTKTGEARRIELVVTTMYDDNGRFTGVLSSFQDVTDLLRFKLKAGKVNRFDNIIGQDIKMLQVFQQIQNVSAYDYPVHIEGETGTGKELVAVAIHEESHRGGAPFVPINCGALPEGLIESELFGHVRGAFSGAVRDKKGRFELAAGGTIFLDEIAELSKSMQVRLLRFLQEGTFERVGGEETLTAEVKVISATNKNLKKEVRKGRFREDLYYRLNVIPIALPPLRERKNDIPLLIEHFLAEAGERYHQKRVRFSKDALRVMMDYHWPGNVRELQNVVQFAIVKCNGRVIRREDLPLELGSVECRVAGRGPYRKLDTLSVRTVLQKTAGNKSRAAKMLGVGRATLYRFLGEHPEAADGG